MTRCFADVDFLLKLAAFDLLDEALMDLEVSPSDLRVTPALWHRLRIGRTSLIKKYGAATVERAWVVVSQGAPIVQDFGGNFDQLIRCPGIDPGEALLFLAAADNVNALVAKGEKASNRALASTPVCQDLCTGLAGAIVTLETVLRLMIDRMGAEVVAGRIRASSAIDRNLGFLCGVSISYPPEIVVENFDREIQNMRSATSFGHSDQTTHECQRIVCPHPKTVELPNILRAERPLTATTGSRIPSFCSLRLRTRRVVRRNRTEIEQFSCFPSPDPRRTKKLQTLTDRVRA